MGLIGTYYKFTLLLLLSLLLCVIILFSIMLLIWYPFVRQFPLLSPMLNFMAWRRYAVSAVLAARVCLSVFSRLLSRSGLLRGCGILSISDFLPERPSSVDKGNEHLPRDTHAGMYRYADRHMSVSQNIVF